MAGTGERTLRAKYADWCSARLADRFLELTPEEAYERGRVEGGGYRALVQRVTDSLLEEMSLPTFEQWSAAYAEEPARFDAEMLGFWKEAAEGDGSSEDPSP